MLGRLTAAQVLRVLAQHHPGLIFYDYRTVVGRIMRSNRCSGLDYAGLRSLFGGIDPPSSASFALTPLSAKVLSSASASLWPWRLISHRVPRSGRFVCKKIWPL